MEEHENPSTTSTPLREHHPLSWWLKWASSIVLIFAMIAVAIFLNGIVIWTMETLEYGT